jgi:SAM-dependent methyltransferase
MSSTQPILANDQAPSVYDREAFDDIDIGARMRTGHVDILEGDDWIVARVRAALRDKPDGATIVDIGSGSGVLSERLARELPQHRVVANDPARSNYRRAAERLAAYPNASVFTQPFEAWHEPADVLVSWGSHHHLQHGYLEHIARVLRPGGRFIVGDEFCPEYLRQEELSGRAWLVDGFLFTSADEERNYRTSGAMPESVLARERARRLALWRWYRFVVDQAVERDDWTVALLELQIARDDLTTEFADEHKTSPLLLETELRDGGFEIADRISIGARSPELQSFVVYEAVRKEDRS